jgi:hypothetical protein
MAHRRQVTAEERERRRAQDRERLRQAAEQLLSSEGWRRWVGARASNGLARYSLANQLLVAVQSEGRATLVAGFKQWLRLRVLRDERGACAADHGADNGQGARPRDR